LLVAIIWSCNVSFAQLASADSTSETTVENLTFHYYSLIQKAGNGSLFVYDGADAYGPKLTSGYQTDLNCQIEGQRTMYGLSFTYWGGVIMWAVKLEKDLHVIGDVEMVAYLSSSSTANFGLFDGGGYGMGLADIDENGNEVQQFTTESSPSIGSNPLTATPKAYTLGITVDYVFKKGHAIGFFVGAGSTIQGYTFTAYFDSPDKNSNVKLPIEDLPETYEFSTVWDENTYDIVATSNSALSSFEFNQPTHQVSFNASGIPGTNGYCEVVIPKTLLGGPFKVFTGNQQIATTETENTTHSFINFTYTHNLNTIKIVATTAIPEFSSIIILPLLSIVTLLAVIIYKQKHIVTKSTPRGLCPRIRAIILGFTPAFSIAVWT
jgi:hypothetical protein